LNDEALELMYERGNPNPSRTGCPQRDVLKALARRQRPVDDPLYDHLTQCSPCFNDVRTIQRSQPTRRTRPALSRASRWAAAAVVVVGIGLALIGPGRNWIRPSPSPVPVVLDLTTFSVSRSTGDATALPLLTLQRGPVELTVVLPNGYEPGVYEVQYEASDSSVHASATGQALLRDFVTRVTLPLDLSSAPAGRGRLSVRPSTGDWISAPAVLR
jgi:hypothetical protein